MKEGQIFPSRYLSHEDIDGTTPIYTIKSVGWAEFSDGSKKRSITFKEIDKPLGLNVTNWRTIRDRTGLVDDDLWVGVRVKLGVALVQFKDKMVSAIRVLNAKAPAQSKAELPPPPPEPDFDVQPEFGPGDPDESPF